jgi:alpha-tubulin suppressor-like RCC1 family protein
MYVNITKPIKKVAAGFGYSAALQADGQMVYTWGNRDILGTGVDIGNVRTPVQIDVTGVLNGKTIANIEAGAFVVLLLTTDGKVFSFGDNNLKQLGSGDSPSTVARSAVAVQFGGPTNIIQVGVSFGNAFALSDNGTLYGWGDNSYGMLLQDVADSTYPIVTNTSLVRHIQSFKVCGTAGLVISKSKQVYTFGVNDNGAMGNGQENVALSPLGPIITTAFDSPIVDAAVSENGGAAITTSGKVYTWGANYEGALGVNGALANPPRKTLLGGSLSGKEVSAISAGDGFTIALTTDGKVYSWGDNSNGCLGIDENVAAKSLVPVAVVDRYNLITGTISDIATSDTHVAILSTTGTMYTWGSNAQGQCGDGTAGPIHWVLEDVNVQNKVVVGIALANEVSFALTSEGKVYAWGANNNGLLGDDNILGSPAYNPYAINTTNFAGKFVTKIAAKGKAAALLTSDGRVYTWGFNENGMLGANSTESRIFSTPVAVDVSGALKNKVIRTMCTSRDNMVAIDVYGKVYTWGYGGDYANGEGGVTATRYSPIAIDMTAFSSYVPETVSCGRSTIVVVGNNGIDRATFGWGKTKNEFTDFTQTGTPTRLDSIPRANTIKVSLSIGSYSDLPHAVVLTRMFKEPAVAIPPLMPTHTSTISVIGSNYFGK